MTRLPLTICLALAWFFAANLMLSLAAAAIAWGRRASARGEAQTSGAVALALRFVPSVGSGVFVAGVFIPGFVAHERAGGPEAVGWMLLAAAASAVALGLAAGLRGAGAQRRASALVRAWDAGATPISIGELSGSGVTACAVDDRFPVVALVGVRRPRLYIARQVLQALSQDELRVAVAHEVAHRRAGDNAVRLLMAWSPDVFGWFRASRHLEREWAAAAECAADRRAAAGSPRRSTDLAGALVKVAGLAVGGPPRVPLFSTLHERGEIAARVSRLVGPAAPPRRPRPTRRLMAVAVVVAVAFPGLPATWFVVHAITEACVRLLP